ncbi:MAG: MBL fold metallo-hydrolase [Acetatifactor sp.]|nr:MBL fold metallo-hydrolase [Acetatifactor sp.]
MGEIVIGGMCLGELQTNCYFAYRKGENRAIVIDPADHGKRIFEKLKENGIEVSAILLTHGHFDHIYGVDDLKEAAGGIKVYASEKEKDLLSDTRKNVSRSMGREASVEADVYVHDSEEITIEGMTFKVIETPGHTEGGCCYYFPEGSHLFCGDTLFRESYGRYDFPTGDYNTLMKSIKEKLFLLPDDTKCYPGHGMMTTIGHEKEFNPCLFD